MSVLASLYFENVGRISSFSCRDLIRFQDELDLICKQIDATKISSFCVDSMAIDIEMESHLPEDYLDDEDADLDAIDALESEVENRIGPWFNLSDGIACIQALIQEIERKATADDHSLKLSDDMNHILLSLKEFEQEMVRMSEESSRFRIVYN
jgi:hypothetical protein